MARIAVGGMQHETNTFAPSQATHASFVRGEGRPAATAGEAMFEAVGGANLPIAGAIAALAGAGHQLVPLAWASASPSGPVTDDAFERLVGAMIERLRAAGPLDGVYLDLHGAMVTETHVDGEGEILRRVRDVVGPGVPLVNSLDLHANVTRAMVRHADAMTIYRTYPHVDMADTGARAARMLLQMIAQGMRPAKFFRAFDYLTGLPAQSTFIEPAASLYRLMAELDERHGVALSFAMGFPMADFEECGMSAIGYGTGPAAARAFDAFAAAVVEAERDFAMTLLPPDEAVARAVRHGRPGRPAVIADTQDNPGAGGNGDTTGLLAALLAQDAPDSVLGVMIDPGAAALAHAIGEGGSADFRIGALSGQPGHRPVTGRFTVERLGDGQFTCTGPMFKGFRMNLGPMALLRHGNVRVVLASVKVQAADQAIFRHLGVEPARCRVVALKSSVHYRADFQPIASEVIVAQAPGPSLADPADFAWRHLRPGLRLRPLGPAFGPAASAPSG
ncbi:MAG: M81 family metallopeptidase [Burkholderiaceae bacterium]